MAEFPALPLWTDAYLGDTTHLSNAEHGSYLLLLMVAWRTETTDLPDDDILLAKYARCVPRWWPQMRRVLAPFFQISGGRWVQLRLSEEKSYVVKRRDTAAANGRASALKRKQRHSSKRPTEREQSDQQNVNDLPTPTPTPTPIEDSDPYGSGENAVLVDPEKVIFTAGLALMRDAGITEARARPILGRWKATHGTEAVIVALGRAKREGAIHPTAFIEGCLKDAKPHRPQRPQSANGVGRTEAAARALIAEMSGEPDRGINADRNPHPDPRPRLTQRDEHG